MSMLKTSRTSQVSCPKCNRVNKPGATKCADCRTPLSAKLRDDFSSVNTSPDLTDVAPLDIDELVSIEDAFNGVEIVPDLSPGIGSSVDMADIDSAVDGWMLKNSQSDSRMSQSAGFSPKLLGDKQDPKLARKMYDHAVELLEPNEEVEYILTVDVAESGNGHSGAVASNRRIIIYDRLPSGEVDLDHPDTCLWQDMDDIYFEEDPEISLRFIAISGWHVELKDVHPPQARRLYIYGVDHSERVLRNRVEQHMATHAASPYISAPLGEHKMELIPRNEPNKGSGNSYVATSTSATNLPIVPRERRNDAVQPLQPQPGTDYVYPQPMPAPQPQIQPQPQAYAHVEAQPQPQAQPSAEARPTAPKPAGKGSVLSNIMRAAHAAESGTGSQTPSNPHLTGPSSTPMYTLPMQSDPGSANQTGFISNPLSGRLPEGYNSDPMHGPANQPAPYEYPTGRLSYGHEGNTGPMSRPYDQHGMSGPLSAPHQQPVPQGMPYMYPQPQQPQPQHPYPYAPQIDPQTQYGQPQYGYNPYPPNPNPNPYPYGQPGYNNQYPPQYAPQYAPIPPGYAPPQAQPYMQPQPQQMQPQAQAQPQPQPQQAAPADETDDVMLRLQKLKQMLDAGFITNEDFQAKKNQILSEM